jgi:hypothetical protein
MDVITKELCLFINVEYNFLPKVDRDFILELAIVMLPLDGTLSSEEHPAAKAFIRFRAQHKQLIRAFTPLSYPLRSKVDTIQSIYHIRA